MALRLRAWLLVSLALVVALLTVTPVCHGTVAESTGGDIANSNAAAQPTQQSAASTTTTPSKPKSWHAALYDVTRAIARLPFEDASDARALELLTQLVQSRPASSSSSTPDYSPRFERIFIDRWERRVYPNAVELLQARPDFRESTYTPPLSDEEDVHEEDDENKRPKLIRASIVHVLAGRGFLLALEEVLRNQTTSSARDLVNAECTLAATLNIGNVRPLHLVSLYARDAAHAFWNTSSEDNVLTAAVLLRRGADFTAAAGAKNEEETTRITPMVLAAERGNLNLVRHFLATQTPPPLPADLRDEARWPVPIQAALEEWRVTRREILERREEEIAARDPNDRQPRSDYGFEKFLREFDARKPIPPEVAERAQWMNNLFQAMTLAVMANRVDVVRHLLETESVGLKNWVNQRGHDGRGDTLLHGAILSGFQDMAELLVAHGADITMRTHDQLTAHQLATRYKQFDMVRWIEKLLKKLKPAPKTPKTPPKQTQIHTETVDEPAATTTAQSTATQAHDEL